ncbi:hypothetical protein FACS1894211_06830 [Clostridia bacterium]|nr:hypothetical protein FACS1894211_06830 [Clostridia bacterium]
MQSKEITLSEFISEWIENAIKTTARYSTYNAYEGYIRNHIADSIGGLKLTEITPLHIQKLVRDLYGEKGLSARTIKIVTGVLSAALKFAEDCDYIVRTPYRRIKLPKIAEDEVEAFTNSEQTAIERAVLSSADPRKVGFIIMLYTGIRLNEMTALKWECIDLNAKMLRVKASMNRTENPTGETKTNLHIHTTHSDGGNTPSEVVTLLNEAVLNLCPEILQKDPWDEKKLRKYKQGDLAIFHIRFTNELIEKLLNGVKTFFKGFCRLVFGEDYDEAQWNYTKYFMKQVNSEIDGIRNPLGLPWWI